jgi:pimeloyl-ACP methyl ester carboxylesterase
VIVYDRFGWGGSQAPGELRKTSIAEQAIDAAGVLRSQGESRAEVLGAGFGAVVALELSLAEPELIERVVMLEPPLFDTLPDATEGMSRDVAAIREAAEQGGRDAVWDLFLEGGLPTLGAGAARPGQAGIGAGSEAADALLAELPAVPAWPLDPVRVSAAEPAVTVATTPSTPELLERAANALTPRIPGALRVRSSASGPAAVLELIDADPGSAGAGT